MTVCIFGYGSLVHTATHAHATRPALAPGWRRVWRAVAGEDQAVLSVEPHPASSLQGLLIDVPTASLAALDVRETLYERRSVRLTDLASGTEITAQIYVVAPFVPAADAPILRSYLDVVLAGYEAQFGAGAARQFYQTTGGWHMPVNDDRAAPLYPRHQPLPPDTTARFDKLHLARPR